MHALRGARCTRHSRRARSLKGREGGGRVCWRRLCPINHRAFVVFQVVHHRTISVAFSRHFLSCRLASRAVLIILINKTTGERFFVLHASTGRAAALPPFFCCRSARGTPAQGLPAPLASPSVVGSIISQPLQPSLHSIEARWNALAFKGTSN